MKECKFAAVVCLYENLILNMEGLGGLTKLMELQLHHNLIRKIENLSVLPNLAKLYLDHNLISRLEGLEGCPGLVELSLACQYLPSDVDFDFDPHSLAVIAVPFTR